MTTESPVAPASRVKAVYRYIGPRVADAIVIDQALKSLCGLNPAIEHLKIYRESGVVPDGWFKRKIDGKMECRVFLHSIESGIPERLAISLKDSGWTYVS